MGCSSSSSAGAEDVFNKRTSTEDRPKLSRMTLDKREHAITRAELLFAETEGKRFHENYIRTTLVSYGASCKVLTAWHKRTNKKYAAKAIPKDPQNRELQHAAVLHEVGVMKEVEDHPNAVQLFEVYDEPKQYYMVMEYCEGGELFEHISKSLVGLTERQAAQILTSIMQFLVHMHSKGMAHMDIKPENIMFDSEGAGGILKIIDFGASVYVANDERVKDAFGTVRYSSPEMANDRGIGQKTDVWSAGVVMYLMLCGSPPFIKSSDVDTLNYIKKAPRVKFGGTRWGNISQAAKDCIRAMLEPDPAARPTAQGVLNLPWLRSTGPDHSINPDILAHLRTFANQSRMRRMLLGLMATNLTGSEANRLLSQFYMVDTDSSGTIELPELVQAAQKVLPDVSEAEVARVFNALDVDDTGSIDLKEFFAGLLHTMDADLQSALAFKSFSAMDVGSEGVVRRDVFVKAMVGQARASGLCPTKEQEDKLTSELEQEFRSLDANSDGVLSFEEYKAAMSSTTRHSASQVTAQHIPHVTHVTHHATEDTATANGETGDSREDSSTRLVQPTQKSGVEIRRASSRILSAAATTARVAELVDESKQEALATSHQNLIRLAMEVNEQKRTRSGMAPVSGPRSLMGTPSGSMRRGGESPSQAIVGSAPADPTHILSTRMPLLPTHAHTSSTPCFDSPPFPAPAAGSVSSTNITLQSSLRPSVDRDRASGPPSARSSITAQATVKYNRSCSVGHSAPGYGPGGKDAVMSAVALLLERQRCSPEITGGVPINGAHHRTSQGTVSPYLDTLNDLALMGGGASPRAHAQSAAQSMANSRAGSGRTVSGRPPLELRPPLPPLHVNDPTSTTPGTNNTASSNNPTMRSPWENGPPHASASANGTSSPTPTPQQDGDGPWAGLGGTGSSGKSQYQPVLSPVFSSNEHVLSPVASAGRRDG